mmetsp:Transcript_55714/g.124465  ORF Transcript_55714/g.124465 Transcript_55714/m.124465 type:complete len:210 (+) Transcript_55714:856-1485(+)
MPRLIQTSHSASRRRSRGTPTQTPSSRRRDRRAVARPPDRWRPTRRAVLPCGSIGIPCRVGPAATCGQCHSRSRSPGRARRQGAGRPSGTSLGGTSRRAAGRWRQPRAPAARCSVPSARASAPRGNDRAQAQRVQPQGRQCRPARSLTSAGPRPWRRCAWPAAGRRPRCQRTRSSSKECDRPRESPLSRRPWPRPPAPTRTEQPHRRRS